MTSPPPHDPSRGTWQNPQPPSQGWGTSQSPPPGGQAPAQSGAQWPTQPPPAQSGSAWSTERLPTQPQSPPYGQSSPPYSQYGPPQPQQQYGAASAGQQWGGYQGGPPQGPPRKKSRKPLYAIIAAVVTLALIGGGLFFFLSGEDITYEGRSILEPEMVLSSAEETLDGIVEQRNGATNDATSCYFVLKNAETTDIENRLVCGPVLFVDGDDSQPYLTFPIEAGSGEGDAMLTAAAEPENPEPAEIANRDLLLRPDGGTPPEGNGGLAVPEPPRAEEGLFTVIPLEGVDLDPTESNARIGSPSMSIAVAAFGEPERFGQGDEARRPAEGEKFVAFEIASGPGESGPTGEYSIAVQVGDDGPVPLPDDVELSTDPLALAISVPEDTEDVSLLVNEGSLVQRLSLTTGQPDPGNIALWQRENRSASLSFTAEFAIRLSQPGFVTEDRPTTLTVDGADLAYFAGPGARTPSAPSAAILVLSAEMVIGGESGFLLDPPYWTLALPDGTVLQALNLATEPGLILIGFEVPADFTEGTVNLGGVATQPGGLTLDTLGVVIPVPISIPAG